jgi:hypothetical protein
MARTISLLTICLLALPLAVQADDLKRAASWSPAEPAAVQQRVIQWLSDEELDDTIRSKALDLWSTAPTSADIFPRTVTTLEMADTNAAEIIKHCKANSSVIGLPAVEWLDDEERPEFIRNNMRLYFGKWFAMHQMYNESLEVLTPLSAEQVVDPASLLFYQAASHYRLRDKEAGVALLEKLLENEKDLPKRYSTVAELMLADLKALKPDTLDEVSRLMDSVKVRLGLGRAGKRVRTEEDEVVKKLEKMIDELEKKRQQQQQMMQSGQAGGSKSNNPANDSMLPNMQGSGDVDKKKLGEESDWGNLPPKQREEALQALGKEFPSHYREVIEEYFRKLARDEDQPK